ncbi:unnamed protein product [Arctogadus glacialis]
MVSCRAAARSRPCRRAAFSEAGAINVIPTLEDSARRRLIKDAIREELKERIHEKPLQGYLSTALDPSAG